MTSRQQKCGVLFLLALLVTGKIFHHHFLAHSKCSISKITRATFSLSAESFSTRIIGGQEVPQFSIKYQVSLQSSRGHYCGATLVAPQWVVSAAHCWIPWVLQPRQIFKVKTNNLVKVWILWWGCFRTFCVILENQRTGGLLSSFKTHFPCLMWRLLSSRVNIKH